MSGHKYLWFLLMLLVLFHFILNAASIFLPESARQQSSQHEETTSKLKALLRKTKLELADVKSQVRLHLFFSQHLSTSPPQLFSIIHCSVFYPLSLVRLRKCQRV